MIDNVLTPQASLLAESVVGRLPYTPLPRQYELIRRLSTYAIMRRRNDVFVLNGYAGTGKSSLMGAYVNALADAGMKVVLLAPTGRAAKVFSTFAGLPASTIHRRLYRPCGQPGELRYAMAPNRGENIIFVVDEASMIADDYDERRSLLQQLVKYVYSGNGCGLILMGDTAQLPPVGQPESTAMNPERLVSLGLTPELFMLDKSVRQAALNGILANATMVRRFITGDAPVKNLRLVASAYPDEITVVPGDELEDYYTSSIARYGHENTIVITRSNWRANLINRDIRFRILDAEEEVGNGEKLLITRNNYFWARRERHTLIANGDMATVGWIGSEEEKYGYRFADAELTLPGRSEPLGVKLMLSTLDNDAASLSAAEMMGLYDKVVKSCEGELSERMRKANSDPYYNALQIKHAYCVTCHKAQGGQWREVYIDMAGIHTDDLGADFYRWLYTALTRSSGHVYLINPTLPVV